MSRTVAMIQARLRSQRLPGKVLYELDGRPMIAFMLERVSATPGLDAIVLATGDGPENDALATVTEELGIDVFRGAEDDVLARYVGAARTFDADVIVRLTGDCPLADPEVIAKVLAERAERGQDYCSNVRPPTWPDGLDVSVFSRETLERANAEASRAYQREHVVPWMWEATEFEGGRALSRGNVEAPVDLSHMRWTVDQAEDYLMLRTLAKAAGPNELVGMGWQAIAALLQSRPDIAAINARWGARRRPRQEHRRRCRSRRVMDNVGNRFDVRYQRSLALLERAEGAVPGQAQTFSKAWTQYPRGAAPVFATRADGGRVWDADGNEYIDWPMALGPLLLGHNHPAVVEAVTRQLSEGVAFSLPTEAELALAERLIGWFPYAERVRFGKNGSDATAGAVRAARAVTGRDVVLCCGYHGWQDWFIGTTTRKAGVPAAVSALTVAFPYNDLPALEAALDAHKDAVAAIIMEPMGIVEPSPGYLEAVRKLADAQGAVLIFDECWTGFRIHPQGAFGKFGVAPDLACFGKALGNGVPISVVLGRAEIMNIFDEAFFSFTFGGDLLGIAAADAVLTVLETEPVLDHVGRIGRALIDGFRSLVDWHGLGQHIGLAGYPGRHVMSFAGDGADGLLLKSVFQQESCARGVLAAGWHAPSYAHTDADVATTLDAYNQALSVIADGLCAGDLADRLLGRQVQPVFRKP